MANPYDSPPLVRSDARGELQFALDAFMQRMSTLQASESPDMHVARRLKFFRVSAQPLAS